MLNDMASALAATPGENLIFASPFTGMLRENDAALRQVVIAATSAGIAVPALAADCRGSMPCARRARPPT